MKPTIDPGMLPIEYLIKAAKAVLPYLKMSTDLPDAVQAVHFSPAQKLRFEAERIEKRDQAILTFRNILKSLQENQKQGEE